MIYFHCVKSLLKSTALTNTIWNENIQDVINIYYSANLLLKSYMFYSWLKLYLITKLLMSNSIDSKIILNYIFKIEKTSGSFYKCFTQAIKHVFWILNCIVTQKIFFWKPSTKFKIISSQFKIICMQLTQYIRYYYLVSGLNAHE